MNWWFPEETGHGPCEKGRDQEEDCSKKNWRSDKSWALDQESSSSALFSSAAPWHPAVAAFSRLPSTALPRQGRVFPTPSRLGPWKCTVLVCLSPRTRLTSPREPLEHLAQLTLWFWSVYSGITPVPRNEQGPLSPQLLIMTVTNGLYK